MHFHVRKIFASYCSRYSADLIPVTLHARNSYEIMSITRSKTIYKNVSSTQEMCFHDEDKAQHEYLLV